MVKRTNITICLDKELIENLKDMWRKYARDDLKQKKNPRGFSQFIEFIIRKGLEYLSYGG